jgi:hypothetical protein
MKACGLFMGETFSLGIAYGTNNQSGETPAGIL